MERRMPAFVRATPWSRSRSIVGSSFSPIGGRGDRFRNGAHGDGSSHPRRPPNLPTFPYEPRLEIHYVGTPGIALHNPAFLSSQTPNRGLLGWNMERRGDTR